MSLKAIFKSSKNSHIESVEYEYLLEKPSHGYTMSKYTLVTKHDLGTPYKNVYLERKYTPVDYICHGLLYVSSVYGTINLLKSKIHNHKLIGVGTTVLGVGYIGFTTILEDFIHKKPDINIIQK
jgi:hypothetical protein